MEIPEIWENILFNAPIQDMANLCRGNQQLRSLCNDRRFWIRKFRDGGVPVLREHINYRDWIREYQRSFDAIRTAEARLRFMESTDKPTSINFQSLASLLKF